MPPDGSQDELVHRLPGAGSAQEAPGGDQFHRDPPGERRERDRSRGPVEVLLMDLCATSARMSSILSFGIGAPGVAVHFL